jgi:hypothetical protein
MPDTLMLLSSRAEEKTTTTPEGIFFITHVIDVALLFECSRPRKVYMHVTLGAHTHIHIFFEGKHSFVMTTSGSQQAAERLTPMETRLLHCLLEEEGDLAALLACLQCDEASWAGRKTHPSRWKARVEATRASLERLAERDRRQVRREKQVLHDALFRLRKKLARFGLTIHLINNSYTLAQVQRDYQWEP